MEIIASSRSSDPDQPARAVAKQLGAAGDSATYALGVVIFAVVICVATSAPWAVPSLYLAFVAFSLPHRLWSFSRRKWMFYLVDFCYFANLATIVQLVWYPSSTELQAFIYAMAEGPLAGAIIVWQCAWVFGSPDHYVSLPLPMKWLFWAPFLFYLCWQVLYYILVQVVCRKLIEQNKYDTSYREIFRKAKKYKSFWLPLMPRGSADQRVFMFGFFQLAYTVATLLLFMPVYNSFAAQACWQVIKIALTVYFGARYQCEKLPGDNFLAGYRKLQAMEPHMHIHGPDKGSGKAPAPAQRSGSAEAGDAKAVGPAKGRHHQQVLPQTRSRKDR